MSKQETYYDDVPSFEGVPVIQSEDDMSFKSLLKLFFLIVVQMTCTVANALLLRWCLCKKSERAVVITDKKVEEHPYLETDVDVDGAPTWTPCLSVKGQQPMIKSHIFYFRYGGFKYEIEVDSQLYRSKGIGQKFIVEGIDGGEMDRWHFRASRRKTGLGIMPA